MSLAFQRDPDSAPTLGLKSWIEHDARIVTETCGVPGCSRCFQSRYMFDDHRVDRQRTVEFMKANVKLVEFVDAVDSEFLSDEQLLLLPNHVHAFVLRSRKWFILDIDKIVPIKRLGGGFESLVLPEGY